MQGTLSWHQTLRSHNREFTNNERILSHDVDVLMNSWRQPCDIFLPDGKVVCLQNTHFRQLRLDQRVELRLRDRAFCAGLDGVYGGLNIIYQ